MVPICAVCDWRDTFEFSCVAQLAYACVRNTSTRHDLALCNVHLHTLHAIASPTTTALIVRELAERVDAIETGGLTCAICAQMQPLEDKRVLDETARLEPRLCRPHIVRLRELHPSTEAVAERSWTRRMTVLVEELNRPEDADNPYAYRVAGLLRLYAGTHGVGVCG